MATTTAVPKTRISGGSFLLETRRPEEVFTPEDFTEQHQLIGQTTEEFAVNEILPNAEKIEHKDFSISRDLIKKAGDLGLSGVEIPEAYGGLEMDKVTAAVIADHIAKYAGFATTWGAHSGIGLLPIVYFGTEEQKKKYLPRLAAGEIIGAYALSESTSGSDAMNSRTRAELSADGKHYILNGEKMWITNAGFADLFTVFAKIGDKFTAFLVERNFPGFSIGGEEHKMGIRGSSTCPIILNDCKVPVENLLGEIGKGATIAFNILNIGRFKLGAMCVGGGRVSLENAIGYAKQRKAFGKVIADFGLVRENIANMDMMLPSGKSTKPAPTPTRKSARRSRSTRSSARSSRSGARR
jgi:butyryl-CoA dehydrogenase